MKNYLIASILLLSSTLFAQKEKEVPLSSDLKKVTVFFLGAQVEHQANTQLKKGKQEVVFTKLTDFLDPNTVQVKANGDLTILSVRTRKNFEDIRISNDKMDALNAQRLVLEKKEIALRDEYEILELDKELLMRNRDLKGQDKGISMIELKEAYAFMHQKMNEITVRESAIYDELEKLTKEMNKLEQEILSQRSKPVINYTEIVVEIDVEKETDASFFFNYISPKASWKPYYDMRSDGIGKPIKLEAKALVSQNTGIEWKDVDMVLSTNDPYENSKEPVIAPWYINYNNYPQQKYQTQRNLPTVDYSGERIQGEVIDANTGEPMPFTKISFPSNPSIGVVTDVDGKFSVTVPRNERQIIASFVGYQSSTQPINAPYIKFFLVADEVNLEEVNVMSDDVYSDSTITREDISRMPVRDVRVSNKKRGRKIKAFATAYDDESRKAEDKKANYAQTNVVKKDLRMEYQIQSKMTIPTDGMDHRVQIDNFDLNASYEYHTAPKIDPAVFLAAQVTGWEKLNLLSGESNIYFDGTYIGKSYIDVNSTKDTLSFSFGKDSKINVERTKVKDKSSNKILGSRQKHEAMWEIKIRNNGGALIPLIVKDQFPISTNNEIKVKRNELENGELNEETGIITWKLSLPVGNSQIYQFGYSVDYEKGRVLYLE
ncbi:MAG: mucoidy inhibitor MuiA family protein [Bacteroidetes bacterium]|nr:mucoidy inhibitor MuiA family protein [Bacteroidota bacterium]